jgi:F0F1-type ATP synthase assembly protein I
VDLRERRDTYNGFGEAFSRGFELAVTPALFGFLGYVIDRWLGIVPVLTIVFLLFALVGMFVKIWYAYDGEMKRHEAERPWGKAIP